MNQNNYFALRVIFIVFIIAASLFFFLAGPVITQNQTYHIFSDSRTIFGIPHAMNVLSNIFFAMVGIIGLKELLPSQPDLATRQSWLWFFCSILLIAPGSAYYHWAPHDATLVWDRLPMSMGFMALYVALISEHICLRFQRFIHLALVIGILSVLNWVITADLRFYFWIQFSSFLTIPLILILFRSQYSLKIYYFFSLTIYALAKWAEVRDGEIFRLTGNVLSGHTLKHFLAALGLFVLWWMVRNRKEINRGII